MEKNIKNSKCFERVKVDYSKSNMLQAKSREIELESIKRGLKDLDDGKVYSHNTARKIYERYL